MQKGIPSPAEHLSDELEVGEEPGEEVSSQSENGGKGDPPEPIDVDDDEEEEAAGVELGTPSEHII
jgi:hypothetical protein